MDFTTYYICLLRKAPAWTGAKSSELEQLQAHHVAHTLGHVTSGAALAAGPVTDGGDIVGFAIFVTPTIEEAHTRMAADPAVQAGRFVFELHPWITPKGQLPEPMA
jgi:uncharacterized protein YciI